MRQEVTRAHTAKGWALDGVVLYNDVTKMMKEDITAPPPVEIGKFNGSKHGLKQNQHKTDVLLAEEVATK